METDRRSDEEVSCLAAEQDAAVVLARAVGPVRVMGAGTVHVDKEAVHRTAQEDRPPAARGEHVVVLYRACYSTSLLASSITDTSWKCEKKVACMCIIPETCFNFQSIHDCLDTH